MQNYTPPSGSEYISRILTFVQDVSDEGTRLDKELQTDSASDAVFRSCMWQTWKKCHDGIEKYLTDATLTKEQLDALIDELYNSDLLCQTGLTEEEKGWASIMIALAVMKCAVIRGSVIRESVIVEVASSFQGLLDAYHDEQRPLQSFPYYPPHPGQDEMATVIVENAKKASGSRKLMHEIVEQMTAKATELRLSTQPLF